MLSYSLQYLQRYLPRYSLRYPVRYSVLLLSIAWNLLAAEECLLEVAEGVQGVVGTEPFQSGKICSDSCSGLCSGFCSRQKMNLLLQVPQIGGQIGGKYRSVLDFLNNSFTSFLRASPASSQTIQDANSQLSSESTGAIYDLNNCEVSFEAFGETLFAADIEDGFQSLDQESPSVLESVTQGLNDPLRSIESPKGTTLELLTLQKALNLLESSSLEMEELRLVSDKARQFRRDSYWQLTPTLSASASGGYSQDFGEGLAAPASPGVTLKTLRGALSLRQPLINLSIISGLKEAGSYCRAQLAHVKENQDTLRRRCITLYLNLVEYCEMLQLSQSELIRLRLYDEVIEERVRQGLEAASEKLHASSLIAESEWKMIDYTQRIKSIHRELETLLSVRFQKISAPISLGILFEKLPYYLQKISQLQKLSNDASRNTLRLKGGLESGTINTHLMKEPLETTQGVENSSKHFNLRDVASKAYLMRPDRQALFQQLKQQWWSHKRYRNDYLPSLWMNVGSDWSSLSTESGPYHGHGRGHYVALQLSWSLFDGGQRRLYKNQSKSEYERLKVALKGFDQMIYDQVLSSYERWISSKRGVVFALKQREYQECRHQDVAERWKAGDDDRLELLSSYLTLENSEAMLVKRKHLLYEATLELYEKCGLLDRAFEEIENWDNR